MTKKEVEIQNALGTVEPQNLTIDEFTYWVNLIIPQRMMHEEISRIMPRISINEFYRELHKKIQMWLR